MVTFLTWVFLMQMRNESLVADDTKDSNFGNHLNADAKPNHACEQPLREAQLADVDQFPALDRAGGIDRKESRSEPT